MHHEDWELIIGLEIHAQLNTRSNMFGPEPNRYGDEPNVNIGYLNTGQPGALPVINKEAVKKAVNFGLATKARINLTSIFDRKSYFYPDCPLNYQITQFYEPIVTGGLVELHLEGTKKVFTIHHAHLENDAGKLLHFSQFAGVDFNRSGAPLLEIVSDPCMHSPEEASLYAKSIKAILEYIDSSECNMQEGQFRMDINLSVKKRGEKHLRPKTEIKNMNSFAHMEMAIRSEMQRQINFYERYPDQKITSGTYRFDLETGKTILMRAKETADDYRYFPEPDLPPLMLTSAYVDDLRRELPELPQDRLKRYKEDLTLSDYSSELLVNDKRLSDDFEKGLKISKNPKAFCNWLTVEFVGRIKDTGKTLSELGIDVVHISELVNLIENNIITGKIAKAIADEMVKHPYKSPKQIIDENPDFVPVTDTTFISQLIREVIQKNSSSIHDYKNGKEKALQFLIGQVMKACKGRVNPEEVKSLLINEISKH